MDDSERSATAPSREDRLKQALRANLRRRKSQAKERAVPDPETDGPVETLDR